MAKQKRTQLRRTAYHEAGHALAAFELGVPIRSVSIVRHDHSWGRVIQKRLRVSDVEWYSLSPRTRDALERRVIVSLAGREADRLIGTRYNNLGARQDFRNAMNVVVHLVGNSEEATAYFRWLVVRTRNFIAAQHRRCALDALANALIARQTLSGVEVFRTVQSAYSANVRGRT